MTSEPLLNSSIVIVMQLIPPTLYSESVQLDVHSCVALNATVGTLNLSDTHQNLFGNISFISPSFTFSDPDLVKFVDCVTLEQPKGDSYAAGSYCFVTER